MTADEPLDLMSRRLLGDEGLWWRILDANPVTYPFRNHGPAAARASLVLENTGGVPALALTARLEGEGGNDLRITVRDDAVSSTFDELVVYAFDGSADVEVERYRYLDADIEGVFEQIRERSGYLNASLEADGVALAPRASERLSGGRNGVPRLAGELAPGTVLELPGAGPATRATRARSF